MAEPSEEDATPEERMAWLRARGVIVEEPGQRSNPTSTGESFTFVLIPADESQMCEELTGPHSDGDALPALLGPKFAGCSLSDDELRTHAAAAGQPVEPSVLRTLMMQGRAESFRLAVPTDANGREGVYFYLDEASSMKGLPKNARASAVACQCGFPGSCEFSGDVYIGRHKWKDGGLIENIDFNMGELGPGAQWMHRAVTENLQHQKETRPDEHAAVQGADPDKPASGEGAGYTWKDEGEEIEIILLVPEGTSKKDVKVDFKRQEVRVSKPSQMSLKLHKTVEVDGCSWTMGRPGQVVITLEKESAAPWPMLLDGLQV